MRHNQCMHFIPAVCLPGTWPKRFTWLDFILGKNILVQMQAKA